MDSKLKKIEKDTRTKKIHYIKIGDIKKVQRDNQITFTLPDSIKPITYKACRIELEDDDNYVWCGENNDSLSKVTLIHKKGLTFGYIYHYGKIFEIYGLSNGHSAIIDKKLSDHESCRNLKEQKPGFSDTAKSIKPLSTRACNEATIRVLFVTTPNGRDAVPDIQQTALSCIEQFNSALWASAVYEQKPRLVFAGIQNLASYTEQTTSPITDLNNLRTLSVATRNTTNADIVIMLGQANWVDNSFTTTPIAIDGRVMQVEATENTAFALMRANTIINGLVFMHEIGHIFGGLHHNDNAVSYAKGYAVDVNNYLWFFGPAGNWQTIMATYQSVNRIDKFSNPSQTLYGEPTGDADHDVVRKIRERMDAVAEFRNGETNIGVIISGNSVLRKNSNYNYRAYTSCETSPLTYKWEFSTNGFDYTTIGTLSTVFLSITTQSYLSLTVTDALGKSKRVTKTLTVSTSTSQPIRQKEGNATTLPDNTVKTVAYPNPVTGNEFNLDIDVVADNQDLSIDLLNNEGKVLSNVSKKALNKGVHIQVINIKDVSNGIYTIKTKIGQQISTQKIVVLR
jgi:hypothetical protein